VNDSLVSPPPVNQTFTLSPVSVPVTSPLTTW
jgi:hypothetical protein